MNGVLGHDSALIRLYWAGDNLGANEMNVVMNHAAGAGSITQPVRATTSFLFACRLIIRKGP